MKKILSLIISLAMVCGVLLSPVKVNAEEYPEIFVGDEKNVTFEVGQEVMYKFVPNQSGAYKVSVGEGWYGFIGVYESPNGICMYGTGDRHLAYDYQEGEDYYIVLRCDGGGEYNIKFEKSLEITSLEIVSLPERTQYYEGATMDDYFLHGLKVKGTLEDNSVQYWSIYESGTLGDHLVSYGIDEAEDKIRVWVSCGGHNLEFDMEIIENPIESIEVASGEFPELIENVNGHYNGEDFIYNTDAIYDLIFKINYKDGGSAFITMYEQVDGYFIRNDDGKQYAQPWSLGNDNYITVTYAGKSLQIPVTIVENPVDHITIDSAPTREYVWGDSAWGYMWEDEYEISMFDLTGLSFTVHYKDNHTETITGEELDPSGAEWRIWTNGAVSVGVNQATFSYMNCDATFDYNIIDTPVKSLEVVKAPNKTVCESTDYYPDFAGMQVKITYKDDTYKFVDFTEGNMVYVPGDVYFCGVEVDGYAMVITDYHGSEKLCYRIEYLGQSYVYEGITFTTDDYVNEIEVNDFSYITNTLDLHLKYFSGREEDVRLDISDAVYFDEYMVGCARTERGMVPYWIHEQYDGWGNLTGYYVSAYWCEIEVEPVFVEDFVTRLYEVCLGRLPDATGMTDWVQRLRSGELSGIQAAYGFIFSNEFKGNNLCNADYIEQLYNAFMGRGSDPAGKADWVGKLESGWTREAVFNGFAFSQEFQNLCADYGIRLGEGIGVPTYGTVPTGCCSVCGKEDGVTAFVKRFYEICLGRGADEVGLNDWTNKLWSHTASGRDIAFGFIFSSEFVNKNYSNEEYVEYLYNAFMGRGSDPIGKADWVGKLNSGWSREAVFNGFVGSQEFIGICNSYGIVRG